MTADEFIMGYHRTLSHDTVFKVQISDGDTEFKTDVYLEDIALAFKENIDAFDVVIKETLMQRADNLNDEGSVTDQEYAAFKKVLELIL